MITSRRANECPHRRSHLASSVLLAPALAATAAALLASACSSSSSEGVARAGASETTTTQSDSTAGADMTAFNACMRRKGVPPSTQGTPRFAAAKLACARFLPRGDDAPDPRDQARQLQLVLRYAACMRRNGLPSYPDPDPNPEGYVKITPEDLIALGLNPSSPKYRAAEEACKKLAP